MAFWADVNNYKSYSIKKVIVNSLNWLRVLLEEVTNFRGFPFFRCTPTCLILE